MKALLSTAVVLYVALCSHAGTISDFVRAEGKAGVEQDAQDGKYKSRKLKFAERIDYSEMRDFVVYIEGRLTNAPAVSGTPIQIVTTRRIAQKGAIFSPHVLAITTGTTVEWPNYDDIFHNVFSISEPKQFDLGLYKEPEVKRVTFDKPGRVDVFCSIHTTMNCIILVLDNPFFAATDQKGRYTITNVPAGTYKLKAWHERLPCQSKEITVPENGDMKVDFVLTISNLPRY